ncbi:MAG TPA: DUF6597 domain-containing transcriptional factor [Blastocatellia bacterium]
MELRYEEWHPPHELRDFISAYWQVEGDASRVPSSAILPDAHVQMVFNFGDPVGLAGPAYSGDQPQRAVVGLLSRAIRLDYRGPVNTFGIRFRPARGPSFLAQPATLLVDRLFPMREISEQLDRAFSLLFAANWRPDQERCRSDLDQILLEQLSLSSPIDELILAVVNQLTAADPISDRCTNCLRTRPFNEASSTKIPGNGRHGAQAIRHGVSVCAFMAGRIDESAGKVGRGCRRARLCGSGSHGEGIPVFWS